MVHALEPNSGNHIDFKAFKVEELMKLYYSKLFPYKVLTKWLSYGNDSKHPQADATFFKRREFCFTLDGDIFVRYNSFKDGSELSSALVAKCPSKIDIGPVYNIDPQRRLAYAGSDKGFVPVERELVFDIDLTDYDDVRTCGKEGHICNRCWPLMAVAIKVITRGLREDFGFENILWVFSGRRGVHCWVCDTRARKLTDEQRSAIAAYFSVYKGQERGMAKLALTKELHPSVQHSKDILHEAWTQYILPRQRLLSSSSTWGAVLQYLDPALREEVERKWSKDGMGSADAMDSEAGTGDDAEPMDEDGSVDVIRWEVLVQCAQAYAKRLKNKNDAAAVHKAVDSIVFAFSYPRLDMEVSKKMNHLLKAPFCVHPKTGKVCVPIDPEEADAFSPDDVPTVAGLLQELEDTADSAQDNNKAEAWRRTSMSGAVDLFDTTFLNHLSTVVNTELAAKSRDAAHKPSLAW